jgi:hypothetical protein
MKPQNRFFLVMGVIILVLGIALYAFLQRDQIPSQVFPAKIHRDCAPWDGSAFTVQIPWQNGTVIDISIWQSPEINLSKTFSFPDDTGQVGNAILIDSTDSPTPLSGTVFFSGVDASTPVEGKFDLRDTAGNQYKGLFHAEWQELMVLCG